MAPVTCLRLINPAHLSAIQHADVAEGVSAMEAFWAAVQADPFWLSTEQSPVHRCILAALAVRDILHSCGREDAVVSRCGLEGRRVSGQPHYSVGIGLPSAPKLQTMWNAHLIVRLGDILIDPSHGQTKRAWNQSPQAVAVLSDLGPKKTITVDAGCDVQVHALHHYPMGGSQYRVAYFKLPRSVDVATRKWRDAPDASHSRRSPLVRAASAMHRTTVETNMVGAN